MQGITETQHGRLQLGLAHCNPEVQGDIYAAGLGWKLHSHIKIEMDWTSWHDPPREIETPPLAIYLQQMTAHQILKWIIATLRVILNLTLHPCKIEVVLGICTILPIKPIIPLTTWPLLRTELSRNATSQGPNLKGDIYNLCLYQAPVRGQR